MGKIEIKRVEEIKELVYTAQNNINEAIKSNQYYPFITNLVSTYNSTYLKDKKILLNGYGFYYEDERVKVNINFFLEDEFQRCNPKMEFDLKTDVKAGWIVGQYLNELKKMSSFCDDLVNWDDMIAKDIYYGDGSYNVKIYANHYAYLAKVKDLENIVMQNIDNIVKIIMMSFNIISAQYTYDIQ